MRWYHEKGMYNQLMEVMARLDGRTRPAHGKKTSIEKMWRTPGIKKIDGLTAENQLLRDDNARLKVF